MNSDNNLQDPFLEMMRSQQCDVSIYLVNGIKLTGKIDAFDENVVFLKNHASQMVFKHAISTIVPPGGLKMSHTYDADKGVFVLSHESA